MMHLPHLGYNYCIGIYKFSCMSVLFPNSIALLLARISDRSALRPLGALFFVLKSTPARQRAFERAKGQCGYDGIRADH